MQGFFQEGFQEIINYEKDFIGKKTRQQKKYEKVQRLKHDLNDPQLKKQRHQTRRALQKKKLQKQLQGLTQQQARIYLDGKKQKKKIARQKILKSLKQGQLIFVDIVFEKKMNQKQNKSLAIQIQLIMKSIRHIQNPPGIHLCSVSGVVKTQLQKMSYHYWTLQSHHQNVVEVGQKVNKKLVYLSPDAPQPLQSVDLNTAYIIGGLVDRTVIKNASYDRAKQLNIEARHLPIRQMMINRTCLNLDHVVMILMKFKQCNNWKQAFQFGAPKRWKRAQNQKKQKIQGQQESESQSQIEKQEFKQQKEQKEQKI